MGDPPSPQDSRQQIWYVAIGDQVYGPGDRTALAQWAAEGRVPPSAFVLASGTRTWRPLADVPELAELPVLAPPLPPEDAWPASPLAEAQPPQFAPVGPTCPYCRGALVIVSPRPPRLGSRDAFLDVRLECTECGVSTAYEDLPDEARTYVRRSAHMNACFWSVVMLIALLCLAVPLCALLLSLR
jgi:hypothetical protein